MEEEGSLVGVDSVVVDEAQQQVFEQHALVLGSAHRSEQPPLLTNTSHPHQKNKKQH